MEVIAPLLHNNSARLEICYLGNNFSLPLRLQSNKWLLSGSLKFTQHIYVAIFFPCVLMYELNHHDCITFTLNLLFPYFLKVLFLSPFYDLCFCFHLLSLLSLLTCYLCWRQFKYFCVSFFQDKREKNKSSIKYLPLF